MNPVKRLDLRGWGPLIVLVALTLLIASVQPAFVQLQSIQNMTLQAAPIIIIALGLTPVILIGGLDLSVASLASLATVLMALTIPQLGPAGLILVVGMCAVAGGLVGFIQAVAQVPSFIVSLGALGFYAGVALVVSNATTISMGAGQSTLEWLGGGILGLPVSFVLAVFLLVGSAIVVANTVVGRRIYAIGASEPAAIVSGISPVAIRVICFSFSGFCAAIGGAFLLARTSYASPTLADLYLLPALAAVLLGGTALSGGVGSIWRTLVGSLVVVVVQTGLVVVGVDPRVSNLVFGALIIATVAATIDRKHALVVK